MQLASYRDPDLFAPIKRIARPLHLQSVQHTGWMQRSSLWSRSCSWRSIAFVCGHDSFSRWV